MWISVGFAPGVDVGVGVGDASCPASLALADGAGADRDERDESDDEASHQAGSRLLRVHLLCLLPHRFTRVASGGDVRRFVARHRSSG
jgi:hypothetical protein